MHRSSTKFIFLALLFGGVGQASGECLRSHPGGPPPSAYKACEGKDEGGSSWDKTPNGQTIDGTCELDENGKLVLRPDRPPRQPDLQAGLGKT